MAGKSIDLDKHRGMAAQRATEERRNTSGVEADQESLRRREAKLERQLLEEPATDWQHASDKARYVLGLYAASAARGDERIMRLIAAVLEDFDRLSTRNR